MTMRDVIKAAAVNSFPRVDIASATTGTPFRPVCSNLIRSSRKMGK